MKFNYETISFSKNYFTKTIKDNLKKLKTDRGSVFKDKALALIIQKLANNNDFRNKIQEDIHKIEIGKNKIEDYK